jgi:hypothetical protein
MIILVFSENIPIDLETNLLLEMYAFPGVGASLA